MSPAKFTIWFVCLASFAPQISCAEGVPPPVCIYFNARNWEDEIWSNAQEQRLVTQPVPQLNWKSTLVVKNRGWDFGTLSGFSTIKIESIFGRVVIEGEVDYDYLHNSGYWPFFSSTFGSSLWMHPFLQGGRVQYGWRASMFSTWKNRTSSGWGFPCSGSVGMYEGIGGMFDWPYSSTPRVASGTEWSVDRWGTWAGYDSTYWPAWHSGNWGLTASFGNTGPSYPAFAVSGKLKMTYILEFYKLEGVPPVTMADFSLRSTDLNYMYARTRSFVSTSYDPDNSGFAPYRGILVNQWSLTLPDGSEVRALGKSFSANMLKTGRYTLTLRSFDDEGMSTERIYKIMVVPQPQQPGGEASVGTDG